MRFFSFSGTFQWQFYPSKNNNIFGGVVLQEFELTVWSPPQKKAQTEKTIHLN